MPKAKEEERARPVRELSKEHQERLADSDMLRAANPNRSGPGVIKPKKEVKDASK